MCGIVAIVASKPLPAQGATLAQMLAVIRHRGPDDEGVHCNGGVAFGFRRLSILDLSVLGHQPMSTPDGAVTIVFNGEIYNFVELRRELEARGHAFLSRSDTEVLLHAYLEWGTDCLTRLNGMWAFLIHDARTGTVFGSRDRFGIKPLYRYERDGVMLFGSEIKSIVASGLYQRSPNLAVAAAFLAEGRLDESDETFYAGIHRIPAAAAFEVDAAGRYREWRYWRLDDAASIPAGSDVVSRFAELFEDAVRVHMRSDVPVGIHLSGGLDSTSIACASARVRRDADARGPLLVFSYITPEFDE
jgi:asparagine synthase (glutamine-hydrolysing)